MKRCVKGLLSVVFMGAMLWFGGCSPILSDKVSVGTGLRNYAELCDDNGVMRKSLNKPYSASVEACLKAADVYAGIPHNDIEVEPNEKHKKAYIKRALEQLEDNGFKLNNNCRLPKWAGHGEIIASMRKEIHQCLMEAANKDDRFLRWSVQEYLFNEYFFQEYFYEVSNDIEERIKYYQRAKMSRERIVENLKKDYALMTEFYEKACKDDETHITNKYYQKACSIAYDTYTNGVSYEGVQVYAPRPEKAALLAPIAQKISTYNKAEEAKRLAEEKRAEAEYERERKIEEAKKAKKKSRNASKT